MLVTNEYGRSLTSSNLYRVSADENIYTFQSYAVVSNVSPNSGSTTGGTILTINGNYFADSTQYPLEVKVGNQPCTILSSTTTTIQCQTSVQPSASQSQYQGSRGLQQYVSSGFTAQVIKKKEFYVESIQKLIVFLRRHCLLIHQHPLVIHHRLMMLCMFQTIPIRKQFGLRVLFVLKKQLIMYSI